MRPVQRLILATLSLGCAGASLAMSPSQRAEWAALAATEQADQEIYRVWFTDPVTARRAAISLHDAVLESDWAHGTLVLALDSAERARLARHAFRIERATDVIARRNRMLQALQQLAEPQLLGQAAAGRVPQEAIPNFSCYETVEETITAAQDLVAAQPTLASYGPIGASWEKTHDLGGWDLNVLKLSNQAVSPPPGGSKPRLFINAAIHAREYVTAPLALAFAKELLKGHGRDADATWILDHHEIHILLHTNPDGRKKAETGLYWRKNTNQAYCGANSNNRGADLNRNFSYSWNITNGQGSSGNVCNETYRGPSAASEPETQAIETYVRSLWPDRRGAGQDDPAPADTSGIHIDLHSYGQLVLWPWGFTQKKAPNGTALQTLGRRFAYYNGHFPEQSIGLYPTDGTSDSISYGELGVAAYTFEMGSTFFQDCTTYQQSIKPGNLAALRYAAKVLRTPYLTPAGPDTLQPALSPARVTAGTPVVLSAQLSAKRFSQANGKEPTPPIAAAEAYIDTPPWLPGAVALPLAAADGAFGSKTETATGTLDTSGLARGRHLVYVRATNSQGQAGPFSAVFLKID